MKNIDNNNIKEFFENPFAGEYLKFCSSVIRQNVTAISVLCGLVEAQVAKETKKHNTKLFDEISGNCRDLMRAAVLSEILYSKEQDFINLNTDVFAAEFVAGCRVVLGERAEVRIVEKSGCYVLANENALRYLLLAFLKRAMTVGEKPSLAEFGSVRESDGRVRIYLTLDVSVDMGVCASVSGVSFESVIEMLAVRSGASCVIADNTISVIFENVKDTADAVFECRPYFPSDGLFSAYRVMLGDSDELSTKNIF